MKGWKTIVSKKLHENPWFSVEEDLVLRPNGKETKYYIVRKPTGVVIIPFDGKRIYLVNQYRQAVKERTWELPAGGCESKDPVDDAKRELREETGMVANSWTYLGQFAYATGHLDQFSKIFLAEELTQQSPNRDAGEEDMEVASFSLKEIDTMIEKGEIIDSGTITPLYFFKQFKKL